MQKYFQTITARLLLLLLLLFGLTITPYAMGAASAVDSSSKGQICQGIGLTGGNCTDSSGQTGVTNLVSTIVNLISWIVGIIAVIMIIVAGLKYVTSGGSSEKIGSAKNTLMYALIGIAIVVLAQFLVAFTVNTANNCAQKAGTPMTATGCPTK